MIKFLLLSRNGDRDKSGHVDMTMKIQDLESRVRVIQSILNIYDKYRRLLSELDIMLIVLIKLHGRKLERREKERGERYSFLERREVMVPQERRRLRVCSPRVLCM